MKLFLLYQIVEAFCEIGFSEVVISSFKLEELKKVIVMNSKKKI
ncbi:MAG: hypothetical protein ACJA2S_001668 [Cyclobacteriaceae bacterium]|jgi:hypothetical protein